MSNIDDVVSNINSKIKTIIAFQYEFSKNKTEILNQLERIKSKINDLINRKMKLDNEILALNAQLNVLKRELPNDDDKLNSVIKELNRQLAAKESELQNLAAKINKHETFITSLETDLRKVDTNTFNIKDIKDKINDIEENIIKSLPKEGPNSSKFTYATDNNPLMQPVTKSRKLKGGYLYGRSIKRYSKKSQTASKKVKAGYLYRKRNKYKTLSSTRKSKPSKSKRKYFKY